jgi:hypothetical protein
MDWPISLVEELASRRCVVFLGAGASAGCLSAVDGANPPTWGRFLENLKNRIPVDSRTPTIDSLIEKEKYLDAAEVILNKLPAAEFSRAIRELFVQPRYERSSIHESTLKIDPKVVVTTNYDDVYDAYCRTGIAQDGYNVCKYYEQHLATDLRSPVRVIVKAHGCVNDISKIVLSRSQYFKAKQENNEFYAILNSLFMTNTLLFLGYSMSDPDIQLVLENSNIFSRSTHPHYALVGDDIIPDIEESMRKAYNIEFLKYPAGQYDEANKYVAELANQVESVRASHPL